ncbi:hypothetical protein MP228_001147 [Amoeboaphelidium protococcarum]|nr:hypothetical protein MP228_001147 [Amoeboaphelidium protococcarum]
MTIVGIYVARYDFTDQNEDDGNLLNFQEGDLLVVFDNSDNDWWEGAVYPHIDTSGSVPSSYIESAPVKYNATALYDYEQQSELELSFTEGTTLNVFDDELCSGWWLVELDGRFGQVPASYCEPNTDVVLNAPSINVQDLDKEFDESRPQSPQNSQGPAAAMTGDDVAGGGGLVKSFSNKELSLYAAMKESQSQEYVDPLQQYAIEQIQAQEAPVEEFDDFNDDFIPGQHVEQVVKSPSKASASFDFPVVAPQMDGSQYKTVDNAVDTDLCPVTAIIRIGKKQRTREGYLKFSDGNIDFIDDKDKSTIQTWNVNDLAHYKREKKKFMLQPHGNSSPYEFLSNDKNALQRLITQIDTFKGVESSGGKPSAGNSRHSSPVQSQDSLTPANKGKKNMASNQSLKAISSPISGSVIKLSGSRELDAGIVSQDNPAEAPLALKAVVMYEFEGQGDDELKLNVGDRVIVTKKGEEWCHGFKIGDSKNMGVFPRKYIQFEKVETAQQLPEKFQMEVPSGLISKEPERRQVVPPVVSALNAPPIKPPRQRSGNSTPSNSSVVFQSASTTQSPQKPPRAAMPVVVDTEYGHPETPPRLSQNATPKLPPRVTSDAESFSSAAEYYPPETSKLASVESPPRLAPRPQIDAPSITSPSSVNSAESGSIHSTKKQMFDNRQWTDTSKTFKVEAAYLGYKDGKVQLHKTNGVKIAVPISKLCKEDVLYVQEQSGVALDDVLTKIDELSVSTAQANISAWQPQSQSQSRSMSMQSPQDNFKPRAVKDPYSYAGFNWLEYFLSCKIDQEDAQQYAEKFVQEKMDQDVMEHLTRVIMKEMGMREGDILRVLAKQKIQSQSSVGQSSMPVFAQAAQQTMSQDTLERRRGRPSMDKLQQGLDFFSKVADPAVALNKEPVAAQGLRPASVDQQVKPPISTGTTSPGPAMKVDPKEKDAELKNIAYLDSLLAKKVATIDRTQSPQMKQDMMEQLKRDEELAKRLQEEELKRAKTSSNGSLNSQPRVAIQQQQRQAAPIKDSAPKTDLFTSASAVAQPAVSAQAQSNFPSFAAPVNQQQQNSNNNTLRRGRQQQQQQQSQQSVAVPAINPDTLFDNAKSKLAQQSNNYSGQQSGIPQRPSSVSNAFQQQQSPMNSVQSGALNSGLSDAFMVSGSSVPFERPASVQSQPTRSQIAPTSYPQQQQQPPLMSEYPQMQQYPPQQSQSNQPLISNPQSGFQSGFNAGSYNQFNQPGSGMAGSVGSGQGGTPFSTDLFSQNSFASAIPQQNTGSNLSFGGSNMYGQQQQQMYSHQQVSQSSTLQQYNQSGLNQQQQQQPDPSDKYSAFRMAGNEPSLFDMFGNVQSANTAPNGPAANDIKSGQPLQSGQQQSSGPFQNNVPYNQWF